MSERSSTECFQEGWDAHSAGAQRKDCPYPTETEEAEDWVEGWDSYEGLDEDGDGNDD